MKTSTKGLAYYKIDTDRYDDIRIKKLKNDCGAIGVAIYDYILCQIYKGEGFYILVDDELLLHVSFYLNVKRQNVTEVINYACAMGLFDKELYARESVLTSVGIQTRWLQITKKTKRAVPEVEEEYWLCQLTRQQTCQQTCQPTCQPTNVKCQPTLAECQPTKAQCQPTCQPTLIKKENEKDVFPPAPPIIEKDKEKRPHIKGGDPQIFEDGEIDEVEPTPQPALTPAEKRELALKAFDKHKQEFYDELVPYVDQYGKDMIRDFYDYWSEPNKSGTKMRKELQPTWETARRLVTWSNRNYNNSNGRNATNPAGGSAASPTNGQPRDNYSEISDFVGQVIV